ncbi:MAG: cob(I)yrinic acid a,c-diamide adenosyltransferase [Prevotella sp.]|uniref:cob(I)yrinic acid a,c-diamide adenosyltransferase n=1 Tax=Prevotella sp. TaxID=59823 RepID=UPI002A2AF26E|nr:cob(I)yrinic acid a,c-diamide adenosyltransferase [Prevotella sp.]MDD7317808.1 cob(I)yrinic acid a,c-diamide adenosyltransferase [Prevotellaceae bacterium]MDY4020723.1 cob(I)yrinic acid a,c-diamide adenosyltransferase [Prevotella sp.]
MAITRIYTKTGDNGTTSLVGGVKVSKTNPRIEAYGTVDELSAHLGMLAAWLKEGEDRELIIRTQRNLFTVCSYLATDKSKTPLSPSCMISEDETTLLEKKIDEINAAVPPQRSFILPGGSRESAIAHVCRTICRRAERRIFALGEIAELDKEVTHYVNRLSDYLFVLARKLNFDAGVEDEIWVK